MSTDFIIVTYWWGDDSELCKNSTTSYLKSIKVNMTYKQLIENLKVRCAELRLPFDCVKISVPKVNGYQFGISYKPVFIEKMLRRWKRPVLYIDCDMYIHRYPHFITYTNKQYDFMAFNWNADTRVYANSIMKNPDFDWHTLTTSGGLLYFNYTPNAIKFIKTWQRKILLFSSKADDKLLDICFKEVNAKRWLKYYWFPMEYFYIPQYFSMISLKNIVISHPYKLTSESTIEINRYPSEYKMIVINTTNYYTHIVERLKKHKYWKLFLNCLKDRNKHYVKCGYIYILEYVESIDSLTNC